MGFAMRGEGRLFYAAELRYATVALPKEPKDMGLFVKKMVRAARIGLSFAADELHDAVVKLMREGQELPYHFSLEVR